MNPDNAAAIVASVLRTESATAYAPTNPGYGLIVITDELWLGTAYVEYVRIDGLATRGYADTVELHTTAGTFDSSESADPEPIAGIARRIRDAINAVVTA